MKFGYKLLYGCDGGSKGEHAEKVNVTLGATSSTETKEISERTRAISFNA